MILNRDPAFLTQVGSGRWFQDYGKLSVRYIKEILRLRYEVGLSQRDISHSVRVSVGSVNQYLARSCTGGSRTADLPDDMDQKGLVRALLSPEQPSASASGFVDARLADGDF